ncbi:hypothetical protein Kfla_4323 [Kribbella flavida DSM 17836]|uniref:Uncharacterized protein n=1 Tax=Kribbella flavida (strain DSM 17836 / JCM 10339 / NBRC 14399) TaxID=479435 RepID=D2PV76_KRIFD|nr:hypothetical protein Kfla_4323 [Kribbella flavida DSM 17836]
MPTSTGARPRGRSDGQTACTTWLLTLPPGAALTATETALRADRGQKVAIGLTGLPDVPAKRTGATASWKSH